MIATHDLEALRYFDELGDVSAQRAVVQRDAYRWTMAAADRAAVLWLPLEASRWYREALWLATALGLPAAERAAVARSSYETSVGTLTVEYSYEAATAALALYEEAGDELMAGAARSWLIIPTFQQGRLDEALALGRQALEQLEPFGETRELAAALRQLGQVQWRIGATDAADEILRRAEAIARDVGARDIQAAAVQDLGINLWQSGRPEESLATLEEAFRLAKELGERLNLQRIYNNYSTTLAGYGGYERAREVAAEGVELGYRIGGIGWLAWMVGTLGEIDLALGDLRSAEELSREALGYAIDAHDEPLMTLRYPIYAQVLLLRGRVDEASEAMAAAHELLGDEDEEPQGVIPRSLTEAMLASSDGNADEGLAFLRHGVEVAERYTVDQLPQLFTELVRELVSRGALDEARAVRASLDRGLSPVSPGVRHRRRRSAGRRRRCSGGRVLHGGRAVRGVGGQGRPGRVPSSTSGGRSGGRGCDPRTSFEEGRDLLVACDARFFLPEAESELASLDV